MRCFMFIVADISLSLSIFSAQRLWTVYDVCVDVSFLYRMRIIVDYFQ